MSKTLLKIPSASPNPFAESFVISFIVNTNSTVSFQLINSSGQIIFNNMIEANDGMNQFHYMDEKGLQTGVYFAVRFCNVEKKVQKIFKK